LQRIDGTDIHAKKGSIRVRGAEITEACGLGEILRRQRVTLFMGAYRMNAHAFFITGHVMPLLAADFAGVTADTFI
jgi:hypothetical protein